MNHNKKRNTAFLYEVLLREGTKYTLEKNLQKAKLIKSILFEFFKQGTEIQKELELYNSLKENIIEKEYAENYLKEVEKRYDSLNKQKLFNEQTSLINKINKTIGSNVFNTFVPNYKDLATIAQIFNSKTKVKEKILLEKNILEKITILNEKKDTKLQSVDNLLFKTFTKKFNEKYNYLLSEQKQLLNNYISSLNSNNIEFKVYLNEELARLKILINESLNKEEIKKNSDLEEKVKITYDFLESFKQVKELNQDMLQKILKIQQFVHEVGNNG